MAILAGFIAQVAADRLGDIGPFQVDIADNIHRILYIVLSPVWYTLYYMLFSICK